MDKTGEVCDETEIYTFSNEIQFGIFTKEKLSHVTDQNKHCFGFAGWPGEMSATVLWMICQ